MKLALEEKDLDIIEQQKRKEFEASITGTSWLSGKSRQNWKHTKV